MARHAMFTDYNRPEGFSTRWAADRPTLLDFAVINGAGGLADLFDETVKRTPELQIIGMNPIKGTVYKSMVRTANPTVAFRHANEGAKTGKATRTLQQVDAHIINPRWECDAAAADASDDGPENFIQDEAEAILEAVWQHLGAQFYYGAKNDKKGHAGLVDLLDPAYVVDVAGTTTAQHTSVWGIRLGDRNVDWVIGNGGSLTVSPVRIGDATDKDGNRFTAYIQELAAHIGLRVRNRIAVGRIKKLTEDANKGWNDGHTATLLKKMGAQRPDVLLASQTQVEELRMSRATDLLPQPPMPTESMGIPIQVTDSIKIGEAI